MRLGNLFDLHERDDAARLEMNAKPRVSGEAKRAIGASDGDDPCTVPPKPERSLGAALVGLTYGAHRGSRRVEHEDHPCSRVALDMGRATVFRVIRRQASCGFES